MFPKLRKCSCVATGVIKFTYAQPVGVHVCSAAGPGYTILVLGIAFDQKLFLFRVNYKQRI